jgi:mannose-6-phosphate isomerase-like protein (cupin superfamily)
MTSLDRLILTPHESVCVTRLSPEALEVEGCWEPAGAAPPKHLHPGQAERFEILEGSLRARVDGEELLLHPGDRLDVPAGAVHQMWNDGDVPARATWRTSPAGRTAEWFAELDALQRAGRVGRDGMPGPLAFGVFLTEYRDVIRLAGPQSLLRPLLAALAIAGRVRGLRPGGSPAPSAARA